MKRYSTNLPLVIMAAVALISGCTKDSVFDAGDCFVNYTASVSTAAGSIETKAASFQGESIELVSVDGGSCMQMTMNAVLNMGIEVETLQTRGDLANDNQDGNKGDIALQSLTNQITSFKVAAWTGGIASIPAYTDVTYTDSKWSTSSTYLWKKGDIKTFVAYANPPSSGATIASTSAGTQTLTYTVPTSVSAQKDILMGYYCGNGNGSGTAAIKFFHPLTAVKFVAGNLSGVTCVKSITLTDVYKNGTTTQSSAEPNFIWSGTSETISVSQTINKSNPQSQDNLGDAFLLIPQNLVSKNAKITVVATIDGTDKELEALITLGEWKAGYTNTYTLGYKDEWEYYVEGMSPVIMSYAGGNKEMSVKSYRKNQITGDAEAVAWNLEYSTDGENWSTTKPEWLSFDTTSGTGGTSGESLTAAISAQSGVPAGEKPVKERHDANLKAAAPKGTSTERFDLSYFNTATGQETTTRSTANTYVVSASGYYKIPLVYGNAIKNDATNTEAFIAPDPGTGTYTHYLRAFVNHADKPISDPWIKNGLNFNGSTIGSSGLNACIVWQDADNLISNVRIDGDYLTFDVANSTITQGNCMVAVRNSSNTILWSWQIWVTDEDLSDTPTVTISGKQYDFMKVLLGWYSTGNAPVVSYEGRSCYVRASNGRAASSALVTQTKHEEVSISTRGSCTMYQWGRKDPFPGGDGNFDNKFRGIFQNTYNVEFCSPDRLEYVSIGKAIQRPYYMNFSYDYFWDWNDICYTNFWNSTVNISDEKLNMQGYDYNQYKSIQTTKTIYDPSPVGFTLPNGQAYDGIVAQESGTYRYDSNARGFLYESTSGKIFIPCCGYRNAAMLGMSGSSHFWYDTQGFAIWSSTTAHLPTSFMLQYDPDDPNCASNRMTTSNSNRPYLLGIALVTE